MASVQRLQEQQQQLQERFEALSLGAPVPPLLELLSADALQSLVSHPYLPDVDRLFARLLQHSARETVSEEDTELFNQCYAELRGRVLAAQDPATAAPRSSTPGDQYLYVSRSGREYDTRQPPPYPATGATPCIGPTSPARRAPSATSSETLAGDLAPGPGPHSTSRAQSIKFALIHKVHTFSPSSTPHRLTPHRLCPLRSHHSPTLSTCGIPASALPLRNFDIHQPQPILFRDFCLAPSCKLYQHVLRQRAGPLSTVGISISLVL